MALCAAGFLYIFLGPGAERFEEHPVPLDKDEFDNTTFPRGVIKDGEALYTAVNRVYNLGFLVTDSNMLKDSYKDSLFSEGGQKKQSGPLSVDYMNKLISNEETNKQRAELFKSFLGIKPGMNIADVGAGPGTLTEHLARAVQPGGQVWASEPDLQTVSVLYRRAQSWRLPNITLLYSYYDDSLLPVDTFDLVLLINVHAFAYPNKQGYKKQKQLVVAFYKTIAKALRPNGRLVIFDTAQNNDKEEQLKAKDIEDQLGEAGFKKLKAHPTKPMSYDCKNGCHFLEFEPTREAGGPTPGPTAR